MAAPLYRLLFAFFAFLLLAGCGNARRARLAKEKAKCVYEDLHFVGTFVDTLYGVGEFVRLKGGRELIVLDSVRIQGKLIPETMVRVRVRRSPGGVCGPTTGEVIRM
jgi:hypothetical protein